MVLEKGWPAHWLWGDQLQAQQAGRRPTRITFTAQQRQQLQDVFPDDVTVIEQYPGEEVHVPPGHVHCVTTVASSIKYAWEVIDLQRLLLYASNLCHIFSRFRDGANNDDYARPLRLLQHAFEIVCGDEDG